MDIVSSAFPTVSEAAFGPGTVETAGGAAAEEAARIRSSRENSELPGLRATGADDIIRERGRRTVSASVSGGLRVLMNFAGTGSELWKARAR